MERGYHATTAGVVNRSKRHTYRQKSHILLILTQIHCIRTSKMSSRCCNALQSFWFIYPWTMSLHSALTITPAHTHKVCYRWTLLSMGFMFRIEYHRTLANGCFEKRSVTVWTWSEGFHIQLWGAVTDRTRKRVGEGEGRLVKNTFFDCSHVCRIMYCSHFTVSAFSASVFTLLDRGCALSRVSVYRCSWTHPRPAALRGSSPPAPGHAKDIIFIYY